MTTGHDGRYSGYAPPAGAQINLMAVPSGYTIPLYGRAQIAIRDGAVDQALPPVELMRAGEIRGLVAGKQARPGTGAVVEAFWNLNEDGEGTGEHRLTTRTGPDGRFIIPGVPEGAEVELSARQRALRTPRPRRARVGEAVILHLTESNGVALDGRVLDDASHPIAGAHVHLRARRDAMDELVEVENGCVFIADAAGRFRTPAELDPDGQYTAYASAPGYLTERTPWTVGRSGSFPVISLRPVRW
jgi:hypothetical protein